MTSKRPELREPLSLKNVKTNTAGNPERFRVILINAEEPLESEFNNDWGREATFVPIPESPNYAQLGWANARYVATHIWWDAVDPTQRDGKINFNLTVLIHEFAHALHFKAIPALDPTFSNDIRAAYRVGCFSPPNINGVPSTQFGGYGCRDHREYWAEVVTYWFTRPPSDIDRWLRWFEADRVMLPYLREWLPTINLNPMSRLGQPIPWEWNEAWNSYE